MKLSKVKIRNFRGVREEEFPVGSGINLIEGKNGCGKSSFLNAIEWCLFGTPQVAGIGTGMQERKGWEVCFRGAVSGGAAKVELIFDTDDGEVTLG